MPVIHAHFWEGLSEEKAKSFIQNITRGIADTGISAHAVEVIIHEIPKTRWGVGGEPASEKSKDVMPPG